MVGRTIFVLGAGIAGLTFAYESAKKGNKIVLLEKADTTGGLAKSFVWKGMDVDLGPHIYHTPDNDIQKYWENEFPGLFFLRHHWAKNYKNNKFYQYPISREFVESLGEVLSKKIYNELENVDEEKLKKSVSFHDYILNLVGPTLQGMFFKDYPEKVWGVSTKELDANWAPKRVEIRDDDLPFYKGQWAAIGMNGSGTIISALTKKCLNKGVDLHSNEAVNSLSVDNEKINKIITNNRVYDVGEDDIVINTCSLTNICKQLNIDTELRFRGIRLIYLLSNKIDTFPKDTDFIYFDSPKVVFNRVSDQNSFIKEPRGDLTIFCCEVTYSPGDDISKISDDELCKIVSRQFQELEFVPGNSIVDTCIVNLSEVYPMFYLGYKEELSKIKSKVDLVRNMYSLGSLAEYAYSDLQVIISKAIDLSDYLNNKTFIVNDLYKNRPKISFNKEISLNNVNIGQSFPVFFIAEIGLNHNGNIDIAKELIDYAIQSGADAVKLQSYKATNRVAKNGKTSRYVEKILGTEETDYEMLSKYQLTYEATKELFDYAKDRIMIFSAPFDAESVDELEKLKTDLYKIASFDLINIPLIKKVAKTGRPIILSTGMATLSEIEAALIAISSCGNKNICLLHCTSSYPCPPEEMNIKAIDTMRSAFNIPVGLSDHVAGDIVSIAAVARGANVIEKHFTLDKDMEGPDHILSLTPEELMTTIKNIRIVEESIGDGIKQPSAIEFNTMLRFKKSIYSSLDIQVGDVITEDMITLKGPAFGILPKFTNIVVGQTVNKFIAKDDPISWDDIG